MALLRRLSAGAMRNFARKAEGTPGGFFGPGLQEKPHGILFGETPPPPGHSRKWESWELPTYSMIVGSLLILGLGLPARPDTSMMTWAKKQAVKELKEEGAL